MSKSSKLYSDKGRVQSSDSIPEHPQHASDLKEKTKAANDSIIRAAVLEALGTPDDLVFVDVKTLHKKDYYRINVYREVKSKTTMTDSFYLVVNKQVVAYCNPPLKKKYYDADLSRLVREKQKQK